MSIAKIIVLVAIAIIGIFVATKILFRLQGKKAGLGMAKQVLPVWAAQGPFDSGADSAIAMRRAFLAVFGTDTLEEMVNAIEQHEVVFDSDPQKWDEVRRIALDGASSNAIALAKGIAAAEKLNAEIFEGDGHRLEITKQSDGNIGLAHKQIWTDEEIDEREKTRRR